MITPYRDNLPINPGDTVEVHRWLKSPFDPSRPGHHRERVFAVGHTTRTGGRGKVIGYVRSITLANARPVYSDPRLAAIAATGNREVAAWIVGTVVDPSTVPGIPSRVVDIDPLSGGTRFIYKDTGETFTGASVVTFSKDGMLA